MRYVVSFQAELQWDAVGSQSKCISCPVSVRMLLVIAGRLSVKTFFLNFVCKVDSTLVDRFFTPAR